MAHARALTIAFVELPLAFRSSPRLFCSLYSIAKRGAKTRAAWAHENAAFLRQDAHARLERVANLRSRTILVACKRAFLAYAQTFFHSIIFFVAYTFVCDICELLRAATAMQRENSLLLVRSDCEHKGGSAAFGRQRLPFGFDALALICSKRVLSTVIVASPQTTLAHKSDSRNFWLLLATAATCSERLAGKLRTTEIR